MIVEASSVHHVTGAKVHVLQGVSSTEQLLVEVGAVIKFIYQLPSEMFGGPDLVFHCIARRDGILHPGTPVGSGVALEQRFPYHLNSTSWSGEEMIKLT